MSDQKYTALLLVIDRSGSMAPIAEAMSDAVSKLLREQAHLPGLSTVDVVLFDHEAKRTHHLADPAQVQLKLEPRGGTALFDTLGAALFDFHRHLQSQPEHARPAVVQVVIVTDGQDTSSSEYTASAIRQIVRAREADGWQFTFLGGEIDAENAAEQVGISRSDAIRFERNHESVRLSMQRSSQRMAQGRSPRADNSGASSTGR
ncbi:vWA domain-containing protein [Microcella humidisoli]|uniref:VWA domain-containing protein n=1 Tax=Microcella humidisoli TaxID=2963406 RepID=A0ABY5FWU5_9MICO|nr:vWA domain-containing protein [Microcella humidisoli]UTT62538.1 VWA domain-containing protein [Microcella humidisoli]UTT62550.1 VWA domain-containing protein [Microcella humidisoli]